MTATHAYNLGDEVTAAWRFPTDNEPFHISGVIRRVEKGSIGIEFGKITAAEQRRILQFVSIQSEQR